MIASMTVERLSKEWVKARLMSGGLWAFLGRGLTAIGGVAVNIVLARILAPAEFGAYFLAVSITSFAALLGQAGLQRTSIRLIAEASAIGNARRSAWVVRESLWLALVLSTGVALILILFGEQIALDLFDSKYLRGSIAIMALWVVLKAIQGLLAELFRGFHDIRLASMFGGATYNLFLLIELLILWFFIHSVSLPDVLLAAILATSFAGAGAAFFMRKHLREPAPDGLSRLQLLSVSGPLFVSTVSIFLLSNADVWIVGASLENADVATYGAAVRLVQAVVVPLLIINNVVPAIVAELHSTGKRHQLEQTLRNVTTIAGVPALAVLALFVFSGDWVLSTVYGAFYSGGALVLAVVSIGQLFNVIAGSCGIVLMMTGHGRDMMWISLLSTTILVISGNIAVHAFGLIGVAVAAALTMILQNTLMLAMVRVRIGIWTHAHLSPFFLLRSVKERITKSR